MSHNPDTIEPFPAPLDDCARNQRDEENREAAEAWREDMRKRLDAQCQGWRDDFNAITDVDEAAELLLGESPYGEY